MKLKKLAIVFALALPCARSQPVTFHQNVAPILFKYCAPCHRPGEAGPFSLLTYDDARKHAVQIAAATSRRYMPPWPPEPGYGDFADSRRLTDQQLRILAQWAAAGAPEGDPAHPTPAPHFEEGWQLGPPDLIVQMPQPYRLDAGGGDVFRNFVIPVNLPRTVYVRALELRPGNKRIVHHANIVVDRERSLRAQDGKDGQPGFPGMDVITQSVGAFDPDSHFLFWKPGTVPSEEPPDMAWRLDPANDLILNLHLQPSGKPETLQPSVGIYFAAKPPTRFPMLVQLEHDDALNIPAGSTTFAVSDHLVLPIDVQVLGIYPHAHYLGKRVEAWAVLPDGSRRWLIRINDWDINWQAVYTYRKPVSLPKGSTVSMRIAYDNSTGNPRNPNHPPRRVMAGNRSSDEMGHVWLQLLPAREDGRVALQDALMHRRLEKNPADFVAQYNLGALLLSKGEPAKSIPHFEAALRAKPSDPTASNSLGAALIAENRLDEAARILSPAVRRNPEYASAHFNLARVLHLQGDLDGAEREYRTYLIARSDDADALFHLGGVYIAQRKFARAIPPLREAARLRPDDPAIWINLGGALATEGDLKGAAEALERAVALDPSNEIARANLARARARQ